MNELTNKSTVSLSISCKQLSAMTAVFIFSNGFNINEWVMLRRFSYFK